MQTPPIFTIPTEQIPNQIKKKSNHKTWIETGSSHRMHDNQQKRPNLFQARRNSDSESWRRRQTQAWSKDSPSPKHRHRRKRIRTQRRTTPMRRLLKLGEAVESPAASVASAVTAPGGGEEWWRRRRLIWRQSRRLCGVGGLDCLFVSVWWGHCPRGMWVPGRGLKCLTSFVLAVDRLDRVCCVTVCLCLIN